MGSDSSQERRKVPPVIQLREETPEEKAESQLLKDSDNPKKRVRDALQMSGLVPEGQEPNPQFLRDCRLVYERDFLDNGLGVPQFVDFLLSEKNKPDFLLIPGWTMRIRATEWLTSNGYALTEDGDYYE